MCCRRRCNNRGCGNRGSWNGSCCGNRDSWNGSNCCNCGDDWNEFEECGRGERGGFRNEGREEFFENRRIYANNSNRSNNFSRPVAQNCMCPQQDYMRNTAILVNCEGNEIMNSNFLGYAPVFRVSENVCGCTDNDDVF